MKNTKISKTIDLCDHNLCYIVDSIVDRIGIGYIFYNIMKCDSNA